MKREMPSGRYLAYGAPASDNIGTDEQAATPSEGDDNAIPDYVAYRHFISVTAVRSGASEAEVAIRDAVLARVGLSEDDRMRYLAAVSTVRDDLLKIDVAMRTTGHTTKALDVLKTQKGDILDAAAAQVLSSLSATGGVRLRAHISDYVKKRIRVHTVVK